RPAPPVCVIRKCPNGSDTENLAPRRKLARQFNWEYHVAGRPAGQARSMAIPYEFFRPEYVWQPLAHPAVFRLALEEVGREFDPREHRFVLIVRGPATRENVLGVAAPVDPTKFPAADVCRAV